MIFDPPLTEAVLLRRYKRFLADIALPGGEETTVHCPNPGAMMGVAPEGARCWVSRSPNKARKLPLTLEVVECEASGGGPIATGVNTNHPNRLAVEAIRAGLVEGVDPKGELLREVRYGEERSRIDLLQPGEPDHISPNGADHYIEIKNCHLMRRSDGTAEFPDCVTARGLKHLRELSRMVAEGHRATLLFVVQRGDAKAVMAARDLDPAYAEGLDEAARAGVVMRAVVCDVSAEAILPRGAVPVLAG
ncbi:DNA/RNA nuclease SfsA [Parvularcula maris]|uniref:Sugar fermentation stimulation protein homolog n=1 Tax=Parvularcula maris TaxID=2965077 RepID=A0A9X2L768_9PROT|nr:DNA/RNA nuclease SfsA [Parvularcula maris]MCQ8184310.1 DNA/RNA nuclease SfsA [Parvularcula maris]